MVCLKSDLKIYRTNTKQLVDKVTILFICHYFILCNMGILYSGKNVKFKSYLLNNRKDVRMAILLIINIISMILCFYVAKHRKANKIFWLLAAFILGPLAIPFVFFSKPTVET